LKNQRTGRLYVMKKINGIKYAWIQLKLLFLYLLNMC
jgi:hypothetical protein